VERARSPISAAMDAMSGLSSPTELSCIVPW
jgi:hypothetical protein